MSEKRRYQNEKLIVKKMFPHARLPWRATSDSIGYDLYSVNDLVIPPHSKECIDTGIQLQLPSGCYGRIAPRSNLAYKHFIDVGAGVIDPGYRGNIYVILFNFGEEPYNVNMKTSIAQLILEKARVVHVIEEHKLSPSERENRGFGSSDSEKLKEEMCMKKIEEK